MSSSLAMAADRCEDAFRKASDRQAFPDRTAALKFFESMKPQCGKDALYLSRLAAFNLEIGRRAESDTIIEEGLVAHPANRELLFSKGNASLSAGRLDEAGSIARALVQNNGDWYASHYLMQRVLMDKRQFAESIAPGKRAIELSGTKSPVLYLNIAVASYHAGLLEECVKFTQIAIQMDPAVLSKPWGIDEAIYALGSLGRKAEALALAKRRKEADPEWKSDAALVRALKIMGVAP